MKEAIGVLNLVKDLALMNTSRQTTRRAMKDL